MTRKLSTSEDKASLRYILDFTHPSDTQPVGGVKTEDEDADMRDLATEGSLSSDDCPDTSRRSNIHSLLNNSSAKVESTYARSDALPRTELPFPYSVYEHGYQRHEREPTIHPLYRSSQASLNASTASYYADAHAPSRSAISPPLSGWCPPDLASLDLHNKSRPSHARRERFYRSRPSSPQQEGAAHLALHPATGRSCGLDFYSLDSGHSGDHRSLAIRQARSSRSSSSTLSSPRQSARVLKGKSGETTRPYDKFKKEVITYFREDHGYPWNKTVQWYSHVLQANGEPCEKRSAQGLQGISYREQVWPVKDDRHRNRWARNKRGQVLVVKANIRKRKILQDIVDFRPKLVQQKPRAILQYRDSKYHFVSAQHLDECQTQSKSSQVVFEVLD